MRFENPEITVLNLQVLDVITTSNGVGCYKDAANCTNLGDACFE